MMTHPPQGYHVGSHFLRSAGRMAVAAPQLPYSTAALARQEAMPLMISEMSLRPRPSQPSTGAYSRSLDLTPPQQKALARLAEYPMRVERLKRLWAHQQDNPLESGPLRGSSRSYSHRRSRSVGYSDARTSYRCSFTGPLSASQIEDLMTREICPEDYELLLLLDDGVKKNRTLSAGAAAALPQAPAGGSWLGEECRICLCAFEQGEDVRLLPSCGHTFHAPCVEQWLSSSRAACPLCGTEVPEVHQ
mmetsp:Transcript_27646/g.54240  ORF Transcript_27646/g.54240 Transcript_27646/m.54240 type:complete len:247 (-) Transcript_27646:113-853(-)